MSPELKVCDSVVGCDAVSKDGMVFLWYEFPTFSEVVFGAESGVPPVWDVVS